MERLGSLVTPVPNDDEAEAISMTDLNHIMNKVVLPGREVFEVVHNHTVGPPLRHARRQLSEGRQLFGFSSSMVSITAGLASLIKVAADMAAEGPPFTLRKRACYHAYCNAYGDLQRAFCGGYKCNSDSHYGRCKNHWENNGKREGRSPDPEACGQAYSITLPGSSPQSVIDAASSIDLAEQRWKQTCAEKNVFSGRTVNWIDTVKRTSDSIEATASKSTPCKEAVTTVSDKLTDLLEKATEGRDMFEDLEKTSRQIRELLENLSGEAAKPVDLKRLAKLIPKVGKIVSKVMAFMERASKMVRKVENLFGKFKNAMNKIVVPLEKVEGPAGELSKMLTEIDDALPLAGAAIKLASSCASASSPCRDNFALKTTADTAYDPLNAFKTALTLCSDSSAKIERVVSGVVDTFSNFFDGLAPLKEPVKKLQEKMTAFVEPVSDLFDQIGGLVGEAYCCTIPEHQQYTQAAATNLLDLATCAADGVMGFAMEEMDTMLDDMMDKVKKTIEPAVVYLQWLLSSLKPIEDALTIPYLSVEAATYDPVDCSLRLPTFAGSQMSLLGGLSSLQLELTPEDDTPTRQSSLGSAIEDACNGAVDAFDELEYGGCCSLFREPLGQNENCDPTGLVVSESCHSMCIQDENGDSENHIRAGFPIKCGPKKTNMPAGWDLCYADAECKGGYCGRNGRGGSLECCADGAGSITYAGYDYCKNQPIGTKCWTDAECASGWCDGNLAGTNHVCRKKKTPGESCSWDVDCTSGACARNVARGGPLVCCDHGVGSTTYAGYDYCKQRPRRTKCVTDSACINKCNNDCGWSGTRCRCG